MNTLNKTLNALVIASIIAVVAYAFNDGYFNTIDTTFSFQDPTGINRMLIGGDWVTIDFASPAAMFLYAMSAVVVFAKSVVKV